MVRSGAGQITNQALWNVFHCMVKTHRAIKLIKMTDDPPASGYS